MSDGFIKLWRKSIDSRAFKSDGLWKVWTWCLMKASHKKRWVSVKVGRYETEVEILPGQFIFGRHSAAKKLRMNPNTIWKRMKKLETMQNCNIESNNQYSIVSIINWEAYQVVEKKSNSKSNSGVTAECQPSNNQVTQTRMYKKEKNEKNKKNITQKKDFASHEPEPYLTKKKRKLSGKRLETFELFWNAFDYKKDRANAADSWLDIPELNNGLVNKIIEAAKIEALGRQETKEKGGTPKMAQGWLSSRRWEDEKSDNHQETDAEYAERMGLN